MWPDLKKPIAWLTSAILSKQNGVTQLTLKIKEFKSEVQ